MAKSIYFLVLIVFLLACKRNDNTADLILYNGKIYTMTAPGDTAEAIAIKEGKILAVGSDQMINQYKTKGTQLRDLLGQTVLPGFIDAHIHPVSGGLAFLECQLYDIFSSEKIIDSLQAYAELNPSKKWIRGEGMWLAAFKHGNPTKELLDKIIPDRPVFVSSSDGHNAWVNTKALELSNITQETSDPIYGVIERIPGTKIPSGTLRESAIDLVREHLPKYNDEDRIAALKKAIELAHSVGITTLNEANATDDYINTYYSLEQQGELQAHINLSLSCDISKGTSEVYRVIARRNELIKKTSQIKANQVKLFMDGVVEGKTAAMLHKYSNDHHAGIANTSPDTATVIINLLDKAGLQIHVHSIGDLATRMTLDAFEYAQKQNGKKDLRHHIAHLHVVHPEDYDRFEKLDVIANFQALWATWDDSYMTELNLPNLGPERMQWQYPIGSLFKEGARLVFGSDWDVSTQNPFYALQVAVTRRGPDTLDREVWTPQHLIDRYHVVHGYTVNGAFLTFRENETGTIQKGKWADLIVIDQNIFTCNPFLLHKTNVIHTFFKGELVYSIQ